MLVDTFGNIDSSDNELTINYTKVKVSNVLYPEEVNAFYDSNIGGT
jgi:hypothetical protein